MIRVIINERLYDEEYVTRYTNGPFLVRRDNGRFLRESDMAPGGDPQKYMVWDKGNGQPMTVVSGICEFSESKPALLGTYEPEGIECKPAFQMLADLANEHLPQEVQEVTGVSWETIEKLAREYATTKPAAILMSFGSVTRIVAMPTEP